MKVGREGYCDGGAPHADLALSGEDDDVAAYVGGEYIGAGYRRVDAGHIRTKVLFVSIDGGEADSRRIAVIEGLFRDIRAEGDDALCYVILR